MKWVLLTGDLMYHLKDFSAKYGALPVLQGINLTIEKGEKVALIGPSGAGKTTLLRKLYELKPDLSSLVHQHHALVDTLSVFHNIYAGRLDKRPTCTNLLNLVKPQKSEVTHVLDLLQKLGMEEKIFEKTGALSGGQRQRVAVARALYRNSPVLLGDEPVSSIDPHQAEVVLELLRKSFETVVLSLHTVHLSLKAFSRILGLKEGRILFDLPGGDVDDQRLQDLYQV